MSELTLEEIRRYGRHLTLPEVGMAGQLRLKASRVVIVGAGGLGSPLGLYLAAAGVGTLGLVDFDVVDESNLQRQVLFGAADVGRPKLEAAAERLREVNPNVELVLHPVRLTSDNALGILEGYDVVVDGSDNFPTRYLVNDACVLLGKPDVYGSIFRFEGQVAVFWGARGPCYRCLFAEPPPPGLVPSCAEGGVLGILPGVIGALQANEAVKLVLGVGEPAVGRLVTFDALRLRFRELRLKKDPRCPICSERPTQTALVDYEELCGTREPVAAGEEDPGEAVEAEAELPFEIRPGELHRWLAEGRAIRLLDVRTPMEYEICRLEGALLIPLQELPRRVAELGQAGDGREVTVAYCHHGIRSAQAVGFLRGRGLPAVNLAGGIERWSLEVDPAVPRY
ncbi:MAG TPA: molybdopterin-synthase adenylyltransferase MoeB [Thermoanaerobaculia bacterium]|nr:molybdopterin-synthase adenylyltransferase MoeB [Thermoanaerobaculia bacterium]